MKKILVVSPLLKGRKEVEAYLKQMVGQKGA
ncbi:hypothetical protein HWB91_gp31 [Bacillus phage vB_BboS-125]|uniref:Uncharacterized protein n=1 Tax=Bacillus phage vB_BboS-125 TaxID=2419618 RepID=A0A3G3BWF7_9CAUD|nr:hypothetical protein HWB91_gp31 [Bacillus phage vB_BboS-125]AYP68401.1 hypothetical protein BboS125_00031 [Bacillus phage vB_BboS-125]